MWKLLVFLCFLIASVFLGIMMIDHPGYLLIILQPWTIQMPFWFAVIVVIFIFILFYLLINGIDRVQFLWFRLNNWLRLRREHLSYSKTQQGLSALIEGQWKRAESLLISGVNQTVEPLINYLGAAKAAHEQLDFEKRDRYIQEAYKTAPSADIAIGLSQAELDIQQGQFEHAKATLNHLRQLSPKHPRVLHLLEKVYVHQSDWQSLLAIMPLMRKVKILTVEQLALFEKNIYCELLKETKGQNLEQIHMMWKNLPKAIKKHPDVVYVYVNLLLQFPQTTNEIGDLIRRTINREWHDELVKIYSDLPFDQPNKQLAIMGGWLNTYGPRQSLLLALGKMCVRVQLWGKAKDYFEKCLTEGPYPEASLEYGKLLETLDDPVQALKIYKDGLSQKTLGSQ